MFKITLALAFVAVCCGLPASEEPVPIVSFRNSVEENGNFHYSFETGDGTKAEQHGELKGTGDEAREVVEGSFEYIAPDGERYEITYIADENGYQPIGKHLPPIPEAIARSIEYNKAHPEQEKP